MNDVPTKISQIVAIFEEDLTNCRLLLFTKYNNFFCNCGFLAKNLANYDPPYKKFHNRTDADFDS